MVDFLVMRGYREPDITREYSLQKILALYRAGIANEKRENRLIGVAIRIGFNAEAGVFKKWLEG